MTDYSSPEGFVSKEVHIQSQGGATARISPYGAHVLSWMTSDGVERLFLSPKTEYRVGAAIRGGIPVIFPQFAGFGSLIKHGFARTQVWQVSKVMPDGAVFQLNQTEQIFASWPHEFQVELAVQIFNERLEVTLTVKNTGAEDFNFTAALHTYLRVDDIASASVSGLQNLTYRDSTKNGDQGYGVAPQLNFPGEVDRIYLNTVKPLQLSSGKGNLLIRSEGFPDSVIWNPGREKCLQLKDMEPDGYRQFVCVEAAAAGKNVLLNPGNSWQGRQILSVTD